MRGLQAELEQRRFARTYAVAGTESEADARNEDSGKKPHQRGVDPAASASSWNRRSQEPRWWCACAASGLDAGPEARCGWVL
jgi:hypothetical protein